MPTARDINIATKTTRFLVEKISKCLVEKIPILMLLSYQPQKEYAKFSPTSLVFSLVKTAAAVAPAIKQATVVVTAIASGIIGEAIMPILNSKSQAKAATLRPEIATPTELTKIALIQPIISKTFFVP